MVGLSFSLKRVASVASALAVYLSTTGCGSISVNDNTSSTSTPPPSQISNSLTTRPRHDLAIIGVDFDPALDVDRLSRREPVNLLVGISNQGSASETAVRISADLWSSDGSTRLLHTERTLESLAAGNVTAVRLANTDAPPFFTRYRLTVKIEPVNGESNTANNTRSLDITVNTSR